MLTLKEKLILTVVALAVALLTLVAGFFLMVEFGAKTEVVRKAIKDVPALYEPPKPEK